MDDLNSGQGRGRPSKFDERLGDKIVELFEKGYTVKQVCQFIGVHPKTLRFWMSKNAPLRASIKEAKFSADDLVETALFHNAVEGDTTAQIFWLKNRQPERWREKKETHVTFENRFEKMTSEELLKEKQRFDQIADRFQRQLEGQVIDVTPEKEREPGDSDGD